MTDSLCKLNLEMTDCCNRGGKVRFRYNCLRCGFETFLFENSVAEYPCPICCIGALGRAPNIITAGPSEVK